MIQLSKLQYIAIVVSMLLTGITVGYSLGSHKVLGESIDEDQVIICVNNSDGIEDNGLVCHLYDTDNVDWYQDANDGTFFNKNDSFDMVTVD